MDRRALVLGGGGVTGIAWATGMIAGLTGLGIDLAAADVIIGRCYVAPASGCVLLKPTHWVLQSYGEKSVTVVVANGDKRYPSVILHGGRELRQLRSICTKITSDCVSWTRPVPDWGQKPGSLPRPSHVRRPGSNARRSGQQRLVRPPVTSTAAECTAVVPQTPLFGAVHQGRCPDDHVGRGQVDVEPGQPGDHARRPGDAGDTAAAQDKRASVHDSHLYSGTTTEAQDLWHSDPHG